ncbi:M48 family metalloprotease [Thiolinea disciformis]|uniref:M48 family metalloprotease n=1 Tax=Thiolinea disciformis TaxID=125614 RepID=UPI0003A779A1|nr:M48 family metalloprotease [Thiolinea disciformis]
MQETKPEALDELHWQPWQAHERESFFAAIERHRRLAWRVSAMCVLAYSVLALVMSLLLAPLFYCVVGLVFDLINLVTPMPDLLGGMFQLITRLLDDPWQIAFAELAQGLVLALLPGLLLMMGLAYPISRTLKQTTWLEEVVQPLSKPFLAERQFHHVVEEMAIAALIPVPQIHVMKGGMNAAALGLPDKPATILVGEDLLKTLNRAQLQAVAAHLIASIAEHDGKIGWQMATVMGVFALIARFAFSVTDPDARHQLRQVVGAIGKPNSVGRAVLLSSLRDPFAEESPKSTRVQRNTTVSLTWREWLSLPLMGPVFMSAFLGQFVNSLLLSPLLALVWRQRKYMADASAVKLTREPNGLASALSQFNNQNTALLKTTWTSHFCVVQPGKVSGLILPTFPTLEKRMKALIRLGAQPMVLAPDQDWQNLWQQAGWKLVLIMLLTLLAIVLISVLLPMLVIVSMMLTMLMTLLPSGLLHTLLR